jgi:hypothetical protein
MGLDTQLPLGPIFLIIGVIMGASGVLTRGNTMYAIPTGINLHGAWCRVMLAFGLIMFIAGRKKAKNIRFANLAPGDRSAEKLK